MHQPINVSFSHKYTAVQNKAASKKKLKKGASIFMYSTSCL